MIWFSGCFVTDFSFSLFLSLIFSTFYLSWLGFISVGGGGWGVLERGLQEGLYRYMNRMLETILYANYQKKF